MREIIIVSFKSNNTWFGPITSDRSPSSFRLRKSSWTVLIGIIILISFDVACFIF